MNTPTPTPRTAAAWSGSFDGEQMSAGQTARALRECSQQLERELVTFTGAYTCTHHTDQQRAACPVCLVTALTAERDQLRAENATLRAAQKACEACDEPTAFEVRQLRARAEAAETAETVALTHWNKQLERAMKAEAQLHALTLICGTNDANKFETWIDRANARAEKAEAQLAVERARLDWLEDHGWVTGEPCDRAAIDARKEQP